MTVFFMSLIRSFQRMCGRIFIRIMIQYVEIGNLNQISTKNVHEKAEGEEARNRDDRITNNCNKTCSFGKTSNSCSAIST